MTLRICLIAGEPSGDALGAPLMRALKEQTGGAIEFSGVGGPLMEAEGLRCLFPMEELSVMGLIEVLPRLLNLLRRIRETADHVVSAAPDILVTIDSPDFSFRVARRVRNEGVTPPRMFHYVAPTVWAWRPERAAKLATLYDGVLCLFPFEPSYFEREGMKAGFVGHPLSGSFDDVPLIDNGVKRLGVFFASRSGELKRMGPILTAVARRYAENHTGVEIVSPTLPHLEERVSALLVDMPCPIHVVANPAHKKIAMKNLDLAVATSGTIGLELSVADVPHVIAYRLNPITWTVVKNKITTKYAHLTNILLDRPAVPEFIQPNCVVDMIARGLETLDSSEQRAAFFDARRLLQGAQRNESPSAQAASFILSKAS